MFNIIKASVNKLSMQTAHIPFYNLSHICDPKNPDSPVTTAVGIFSSFYILVDQLHQCSLCSIVLELKKNNYL